MLIITFTLRSQFTGFVLDMSEPTDFNLFYQITSLVLPFLIALIRSLVVRVVFGFFRFNFGVVIFIKSLFRFS